jgi:hypothetical protein
MLWRIGIAHGDVSLYNLMYNEDNKYGVLNDFDLSTIMKPGARNPNRQGLERTGTLPFMALELLDETGFDGKIPRRYEHELESFAWVLVWVSRCVVGGQESERPRRLKRWLGHDNDVVYESKSTFIRDQRKIPTTSDYRWLESALRRWTQSWDFIFSQIQDLSPVTEKSISEHIQAFIAICTECAEADSNVSVPIVVAWVDGLTDLKFATPDVSALSASPPDPTEAEEHPPLHRNSDGASPSEGVDDDGASIPNDTEFEDTDGDDDHQSGRESNTHTDNASLDTDGDEERG